MPDKEAPINGHQTPEQRIAANAQFQTFEDLDGLNDETLLAIAGDCTEPDNQPDECVPCRAFTILIERSASNVEEIQEADGAPSLGDGEQVLPPALASQIEENREHPENGSPRPQRTVPVVERFAKQVRVLDLMVAELLEGPPIPPPNVSLEELAALTVGAQKWLALVDAQGLELSEKTEAIRAQIQAVVTKVQRG